jgi:nucleotide-binding universal stress UspA family protein
MSTIQRVLVPVDFRLRRGTLTSTTRRMFDRRNVEIVLLHALEYPPCSRRGTELERAMVQMEFLARKEFAFAPVCRCVVRGPAADAILDYARLNEPDIIVMKAGGAPNVGRNSLGHVTEEVLTATPCAVWLEWMTGSGDCARHICCAVRLDESDEAVLCRAAEVARELSAELTIIHAVSPEPEKRAALLWDSVVREHSIRTAQVLVDTLRRKFAPEARLHIAIGGVHEVVSRALYRLDAGLLVAAQREAIFAAQSACPVLRVAQAAWSRAHAPEPGPSRAIGASRTA